MCPVLNYELVHEKWRLLFEPGSRKEVIERLTFPAIQEGKLTGSIMSVSAGQKIPYTTFDRVERVVTRFRELFSESTIVHITRDPLWCVNSRVKVFRADPKRSVRDFFSSVPKVLTYLSKHKAVVSVKFENVVQRPKEWIADVYTRMGWKVDDQYIEKVVGTRDPWVFEGRVMPGLRYFDCICDEPRECILPSEVVSEINSNTKRFIRE